MGEAERIEVGGANGRRFSLSCAPVRQPDGQVFLLELVTDVTERERLQARLTEAERLAAAGELAAGVAHEIRNPAGRHRQRDDAPRRARKPSPARSAPTRWAS